ncbi:MAG: hypothetical protein R3B06_18575 [Kofleriaceae bacterium]
MSVDVALRRFRAEHAGVFGLLWRRLGEFDLVDVSLGDAYVAAMASWPDGVPHNPPTWMATVALSATTGVVSRRGDVEPASPQDDLRVLLAACTAPGLTPEQAQVLVLRAVAGLMPMELATLLGLPEAVVRQRLDGAKVGLRKLGGRSAAGGRSEAQQEADAAAVIATVRGLPGREAAEVAALLDERHGIAFAPRA